MTQHEAESPALKRIYIVLQILTVLWFAFFVLVFMNLPPNALDFNLVYKGF